MITRQQLDELVRFQNGEYLVTSCYLNLDRAQMPPQMLKIRIKDLLQAAQQELSQKAGSHAQRESLRDDFERIEQHVMDEVAMNRHRGLAIFACSGHKFWQAYGLPRIVRNLLIADRDPYVRPLTAILSEYHRYGTVVVDRVQGRIFGVYMRQIQQLEEIVDDVPRRVREGGLGGREERNIERRHSHAVQQHYRHLAGRADALFQQHHFDWLVLGGQREVLREFKDYLHPSLRRRWAGDFHADPGKITPPEVLAQTLEIEEHVEWQQEQKLAEQLIRQAEAGQLAVQGLSETVEALARGEAQLLLVDHGFEMPGYACFACHYPVLAPGDCPHCGQAVEPCADIVDEVIELAMHRNCQVEHVHGPTPLRDNGRIGAMLRYRTEMAAA
jgi:peptide subunit release factor 1 (eRF1)